MLAVSRTIEVQAGGWNKCNGYHSQCATNRQVVIIKLSNTLICMC